MAKIEIAGKLYDPRVLWLQTVLGEITRKNYRGAYPWSFWDCANAFEQHGYDHGAGVVTYRANKIYARWDEWTALAGLLRQIGVELKEFAEYVNGIHPDQPFKYQREGDREFVDVTSGNGWGCCFRAEHLFKLVEKYLDEREAASDKPC